MGNVIPATEIERWRSSGLETLYQAAQAGQGKVLDLLSEPSGRKYLETGLRIRAVEESLLGLFGRGHLHGTVHTCIGQESTGVAIAAEILDGDLITSNHRCHGHFIAATGNWRGLIDEIVGNAEGVCGGVGSSQHLYADNFLSNGQQGGLLPVAAGLALDRKHRSSGNITVSFIGEGTLGEGIVYETLNIGALWNLPHLIVCENNAYSQSTPQHSSVAGDIQARAAAFGIATFEVDTWDAPALIERAAAAIDYVRSNSRPAFLLVHTYRLKAHSKGDDDRDAAERRWFEAVDPLNEAMAADTSMAQYFTEIRAEVDTYAEEALTKPTLDAASYFEDQLPATEDSSWSPVVRENGDGRRQAAQINAVLSKRLESDSGVFLLGEDIADPYGGAFKVTRGLQKAYSDRALTTPISEAAIVGVGIGLALGGNRPIVEIMFGDFLTYTVDQLVNNASKMFHMYNKAVDCPLVVRTPMGGRRGYGPTHSQSLERFFIGLDNTVTLAINSLVSVELQMAGLSKIRCPAIVFENKVDYTKETLVAPAGFTLEQNGAAFPVLRLRPNVGRPNVTLVAYGGIARVVADAIDQIFEDADAVIELIVPTAIHPLDPTPIIDSVTRTGNLVVVEEGAPFASVGAEIAAIVMERVSQPLRLLRIAGAPVPVPSVPALEAQALPNAERLISELRDFLETS